MSNHAPTRVPTPPESQRYLGQAFADATNTKFKHHDNMIFAVLSVTAVALVGIVISTVTLHLDQARFNNQAYLNSTMRTEPEAERLQAKVDGLSKQVETLSQQLQAVKNMAPTPN